jgi:hypothetical protein
MTHALGRPSAASFIVSWPGSGARSPGHQLCEDAPGPGGMQRDGDSVGRDIDALNQQPQNARFFGGRSFDLVDSV